MKHDRYCIKGLKPKLLSGAKRPLIACKPPALLVGAHLEDDFSCTLQVDRLHIISVGAEYRVKLASSVDGYSPISCRIRFQHLRRCCSQSFESVQEPSPFVR